MKYNIILMLLVFLAITSCKSKKNLIENNRIEVVSAKKIINKHYEQGFNKKTIDAKINTSTKIKTPPLQLALKCD